MPRGYCGVIFAARQRFTSIGPLGIFACFRMLCASGFSLHRGASFKLEKAHFAARKKGPENRKNKVKLRPPLCVALGPLGA